METKTLSVLRTFGPPLVHIYNLQTKHYYAEPDVLQQFVKN